MAKAKIKIDMKQINKFRFWIGLGVLALLLIVLSYFQLTAIGGEKEKKAYAEKLKSVKGLSDFKNDKFHGKGILTYAEVAKYEGDFKNSLKQRKPTFL